MPTLAIDDATLHYAHAGSGEPVLAFIHGALCRHTDWRHQLARFAATHRVLAPDLRAHGASDGAPGRVSVEQFADDLIALLDHLGVARAVLVGHSMGCRVALQAWRRAPARVAAMVFVDGAYQVPALLGTIDRAERAVLADAAQARAAALFRDDPAARIRTGFARMFFEERFAAERDAVVAHAAALPAFVPRELMPGFARWDVLEMEPTLATLRVPVLAIASTRMDGRSERAPLRPGETTAWLDALAALVPGARIVRLHDCGHFAMLERPDAVNAQIADFLAVNALSGRAPGR